MVGRWYEFPSHDTSGTVAAQAKRSRYSAAKRPAINRPQRCSETPAHGGGIGPSSFSPAQTNHAASSATNRTPSATTRVSRSDASDDASTAT